MRSLFLKIFLWFWGAMIAIGLTLFLVVTTTRPDPLPQPWRDSTGAALLAYTSAAVSVWEQKGQSALREYLNQQESITGYRLHLCDEGGRELSGRRPENPDAPGLDAPGSLGGPDNLGGPGNIGRPGGRGQRPPRQPWFGVPFLDEPRGRPGPVDWKKLEQFALQRNEASFELSGPRVLVAHTVRSATGTRYFLHAVLPRPRFGRPAAEPGRQTLGVLVVLAMSGLVCYGLVRYLTAPMVSLRAATRQLASGDLSARTGAAQRARRDEVADLGRDFDAMAERIETLVVSQQRLLGDISHELRSPLARLSMALALARRHVVQGATSEEINAALDRIKRETGRLNTLIEQLLQLARLDSGDNESDAQLIDLEHLVRDVIADADFEARETNREVHLLKSESCGLTGSPSLLTSALENVVRNAIRYTPPGTAIEVTLQCSHHSGMTEAIVTVRDYGPGVPESALTDLFRPFYRVADARDRASGGVGLGLAITERAIRLHGGKATARNADGGGLLVELRIPVNSSHR